MQSNQFIEEMGLLAELSYVNFRDISLSKNNIDWKLGVRSWISTFKKKNKIIINEYCKSKRFQEE